MRIAKLIITCLLIFTNAAGCNMKEEGRGNDQHGEVTNRNFGGRNISNSLGTPDLNFMNTTNNATNNRAVSTDLRVADKAENDVQNLPEVKRATIIVSGRNAYVAVSMDKDFHSEFNSNIEDQIAERVRGADSAIQNVYISSRSEFVKQMRQYRNQLHHNGNTTTGVNDGFNSLVQRVFVNHRR